MFKRIFCSRARIRTPITWQKSLERLRVVRLTFIRLILLLSDGLCKEHCIAAALFWKACWRLYRKSGFLFLSLYLKQCKVGIHKLCAGDPVFQPSPSISLTRSGVPRIIPSFHRKKIKEADPVIVQMYLSFCTVSKAIQLAARVRSKLFDSITVPSDLDSVTETVGKLKPYMRPLIRRYVPGIEKIPLHQGLRFVPTWKALPSGPWYSNVLKTSLSKAEATPLVSSSIFSVFFIELASFQALMTFVHARGEQHSQGILWPDFIRYPFDSANDSFSVWSLDWFERRIGPVLPSPTDLGVGAPFGRLSQACTGDGKRRLFAIGNYINQRLLKPYHDWLMSVLRRLQTDGTFDQTRPLDRLAGMKGTVHSVDLSAATDRWPLLLLFSVTQSLDCFRVICS